MATTSHIAAGAKRRLARSLGLLAALVALSVPTNAGAYGWPVKPFDQAHPVRANFGDPRTTFNGPPTMLTLMTANGDFSFHFGVDIAVPDGTAVYAVRSGVASLRGGRTVQVDSGNGFATQYWHIIPTIEPGQHVIENETVLGHVMKGYEHVHFTELVDGKPVNPLAPGHLAPYSDHTQPHVASIGFREPATGSEVIPEFVRGHIVLTAAAYDMPALAVPGIWGNLPVSPARLTWRVERAKDGKVVVAVRTAFDVRGTLPPNTAFWQYYARGARQNMSNFGSLPRAWMVPGVYIYELTREPFDTTRIANGIYRLVVTATDIRGNTGSSTQVFIVRNGRGS